MHENFAGSALFADIASLVVLPNRPMSLAEMSQNSFASIQSDISLRELELLHLVCDRISHSIRTPLGVSMGILDDLQNGINLSQDDKLDAQRALFQILSTLETFRPINSTPIFNPRKCSIAKAIENLNLQIPSKQIAVNIAIDSAHNNERELDCHLIQQALLTIISYLAHYSTSVPKQTEQIAINISTEAEAEKQDKIVVRASNKKIQQLLTSNKRVTWRQLAHIDKRIESLPLIYANNIIDLHLGQTYTKVSKNEVLFVAAL